MKQSLFLTFLLISCVFSGIGQEDSSDRVLPFEFKLDPVMITAVKSGFRVEDFVKRVQEDKSFQEGFKNLRRYANSASNKIEMLDKKGKNEASYFCNSQNYVHNNCRSVVKSDEKISGNFLKKNGGYKYYTARLYADIFLPNDTVCDVYSQKTDLNELPETESLDGIEKHINQLKILIFNPGAEVKGVPLIGKKMAIFDKRMARYYDYTLEKKKHKSGSECYVLTVSEKDSLKERLQDRVVLKNLVTWFEKNSYNVLARDYYLSYVSPMFDFDVNMHVELREVNGKLFVERVNYDGYWDVPFKKTERAKFETRFHDYKSEL